MGLNFDSDNSVRAYCFIFLHFCNWIWAAVFQALGYWISGVFMFLSFLTGFIKVCYCMAVVIFVSFVMSFISYFSHCFYKQFCFIQLFSDVIPINNIILTSLFYIIVIKAILYIRNYSNV